MISALFVCFKLHSDCRFAPVVLGKPFQASSSQKRYSIVFSAESSLRRVSLRLTLAKIRKQPVIINKCYLKITTGHSKLFFRALRVKTPCLKIIYLRFMNFFAQSNIVCIRAELALMFIPLASSTCFTRNSHSG